ncbi:hypothetical protein SAMN04487866_12620 [Thermoactinomyces sp. DSM 45891]|uniref:hypothetical protein n=1 Tax=Thermoactinomyces sp. DSM 45891 TaxID=1761907 RepID=UPI00091F881A|nr:hypothetical protein [Thermoactinomyces sp. DSM 45891]SFX79430.1 hypothetical protein SAMN04487866_12620 [Thermoactinomyces sp. DSM 45891]
MSKKIFLFTVGESFDGTDDDGILEYLTGSYNGPFGGWIDWEIVKKAEITEQDDQLYKIQPFSDEILTLKATAHTEENGLVGSRMFKVERNKKSDPDVWTVLSVDEA